MAAFIIARLTFHEARRSRILLAALLLSLVFLAIYGIGFNFIQREIGAGNFEGGGPDVIQRSEIYNFFTMAGLYVVNFLTVMMTVLTSVATISGEISSGTIQTLVTKPVRRWEIVFGKWLGYVLMITMYLALLAGGVLLIVNLIVNYTPPNAWRGLAFMWLTAVLLLSVSFLGGSALSTLTNGVLVFGLYGIAFVGGWIEQFGFFLDNQTAVNVGIVSSLILPTEALWKRVAFEMQSPLASALGGVSPFSSGSVPSMMMMGYAVLYSVVTLMAAIWVFGKRDL